MSSSTSTTSSKLPLSGKEYICFQSDGKSAHAAHFEKPRESFEKKCVILKGVLQSYRL